MKIKNSSNTIRSYNIGEYAMIAYQINILLTLCNIEKPSPKQVEKIKLLDKAEKASNQSYRSANLKQFNENNLVAPFVGD